MTPFYLTIVLRGIEKRHLLEIQERDYLNYIHAGYILSGLGGHFPNDYALKNISKNSKEQTIEEQKKQEQEIMKAKVINYMYNTNSKFKRKESINNG